MSWTVVFFGVIFVFLQNINATINSFEENYFPVIKREETQISRISKFSLNVTFILDHSTIYLYSTLFD